MASQFIPGGSSSNIVDAVNTGLQTGVSLVERKQIMRLREEQAQRQRDEDALLRPVREAEAAAAIYKTQAGIASMEKNQRLVGELAQQSNQAEDDWLAVMQLGDAKQQARAAVDWTNRWIKFAALKEFSPVWEQRKEIAGKFLQHSMELDMINARMNADITKEAAKPQSPESSFGKLLADYNTAAKSGDTEGAEFIKAKINEEITPKGMRLETGPDGRLIFTQGAASNLTTTGTTRSEQSQFDAERAIREGAELLGTLRPQDVGVRGVIGEDIINKTLAQIRPELADHVTSQNRTRMRTWREGVMRQISADTRFSNADRSAIERLLPQEGIFESLPSAQNKIAAVLSIMQDRAQNEAVRRGGESWTSSPDTIKQAVKDGKVDKAVAVEILSALFPEGPKK